MFNTTAYFYIAEFEGPASLITRELGLEPTETLAKGDPWLPNRPRTHNAWHLRSSLPSSEMFMDRHIDALLTLLEPAAPQILSLHTRFKCGISCVGYYTDQHPGFHLSAPLITRLHNLSLSVDFDLYCLCESES